MGDIITFDSIKPKRLESFYARGRHRAEDEQPPPLPGIQRVSSIKVLGVTMSNNLSIAGHVSALLDTCARTQYGLRVLRGHGHHQDCLDEVFRCTVLAKLLYASPAWSGFCSAADIGKLDRFLDRCRKRYRCWLLAKSARLHSSELCNLADFVSAIEQSTRPPSPSTG